MTEVDVDEASSAVKLYAAYYAAASQEMVERIRLRDQSLNFYAVMVAGVGSLVGAAPERFAAALVLIPIASIYFTLIYVQHHRNITQLIRYRRASSQEIGHTTGLATPSWTASEDFAGAQRQSNGLRMMISTISITPPLLVAVYALLDQSIMAPLKWGLVGVGGVSIAVSLVFISSTHLQRRALVAELNGAASRRKRSIAWALFWALSLAVAFAAGLYAMRWSPLGG